VPGNAIYWDIDAAIEKGFFEDEGFAPEVVIFQSSPQSIQLLVAGEVQLAGAQPEALLAAVVHGSRGFAVISSPAERPDWFLVGRPEIKTLAELKGKFFGTGGLQLGENWWTFKALAKAGLAPADVSMLVVGTSAQKFAALQRGSIAFTVLFQPTAQVAVAEGMSVLYRFSDGGPFPPFSTASPPAGRNRAAMASGCSVRCGAPTTGSTIRPTAPRRSLSCRSTPSAHRTSWRPSTISTSARTRSSVATARSWSRTWTK
jgi:ABC-type nitrate/sulfonate/bicarbonate transport system substrate-binding protein